MTAKKSQWSDFHRAQQELDEMSDEDMSTYLQRIHNAHPGTIGCKTPSHGTDPTRARPNPLKRSNEDEIGTESHRKIAKLAATTLLRGELTETRMTTDNKHASSATAMLDVEKSGNMRGLPQAKTVTSAQKSLSDEAVDLTETSLREGFNLAAGTTIAKTFKKKSDRITSSMALCQRRGEASANQSSTNLQRSTMSKQEVSARAALKTNAANSSYMSGPESSPQGSSQPLSVGSFNPAPSTKASARKLVTKRSTLAVVPVRGAKSKKKIERKYSLSEWATKLQPGVYPALPNDDAMCPADPPARVQTLKGTSIFYFGGEVGHMSEATKHRVRYLVSYGATVLPSFDVEMVTHIVHDVRADVRTFLKMTGLKNLDWVPDQVPIVSWNWVVECQKAKRTVSYMDYTSWRDAPPDYEFVKTNKWKMHRQTSVVSDTNETPANGDVSHISEFTEPEISAQDLTHPESQMSSGTQPTATILGDHSPHSSPLLTRSRSVSLGSVTFSDGLSDFDLSSDRRNSESDNESRDPSKIYYGRPRGFQCDQVAQAGSSAVCHNQPVIDKLKELQALHAAKPGEEETWRVYTYNKAISSLRSYLKPIETITEARNLPGVGEKTAQKIIEIVKTGALRRIEYENTEEVKVIKLFTGIYGVGPDTARKWYARGCRTLNDLKEGKGDVNLSSCQQIGIRHYDDINLRMPRVEAGQIYELIKPIALSIDPKIFIEIMGSYRRGKTDCGDIDILISRDPSDGVTHAGVLEQLLRACKAAGVITEDLVLPESTDEEATELERVYRGLCRLPDVPGSHRRRIDFLTIDWHAKGAALLYYTGDDIFNRSMRLKARKLGYSLNQRGLWSGVVRDPRTGAKLYKGTLVASTTEQEIFNILDVPWQEPPQRIRGI